MRLESIRNSQCCLVGCGWFTCNFTFPDFHHAQKRNLKHMLDCLACAVWTLGSWSQPRRARQVSLQLLGLTTPDVVCPVSFRASACCLPRASRWTGCRNRVLQFWFYMVVVRGLIVQPCAGVLKRPPHLDTPPLVFISESQKCGHGKLNISK